MMIAQNDEDGEWDVPDEDVSSEEEEPPMGEEYEEAIPANKAPRSQHSNRSKARPRSDSNQQLPPAPPAPTHQLPDNGTTRRQTLGGSLKPPLPPPIPKQPVIADELNSFESRRNMFEKGNKIQPSSHAHSPVQGRPSVAHHPPRQIRKSSAPERPPRPPAVVPRGPSRRTSNPPEHSSPDSRIAEQKGHSQNHHHNGRADNPRNDITKALKMELDRRQKPTPSGFVPLPNASNGAAHVTAKAKQPASRKGYQPSETHADHQHHQQPLRSRVSFDNEQQAPDLPPPRIPTAVRPKRPTAKVLPSPSMSKPAHLPSHVNRSPTMTTAHFEDPLHKRPWYHGKIDRAEAERRLCHTSESGAFLVREGKQEQIPYVLSLIYNSHVYHTIVRKKKNGSFAAGKSEKPNEPEFESIEKLVSHYRDHEIYLMSKQPHQGIECSTLLGVHAEKPSRH